MMCTHDDINAHQFVIVRSEINMKKIKIQFSGNDNLFRQCVLCEWRRSKLQLDKNGEAPFSTRNENEWMNIDRIPPCAHRFFVAHLYLSVFSRSMKLYGAWRWLFSSTSTQLPCYHGYRIQRETRECRNCIAWSDVEWSGMEWEWEGNCILDSVVCITSTIFFINERSNSDTETLFSYTQLCVRVVCVRVMCLTAGKFCDNFVAVWKYSFSFFYCSLQSGVEAVSMVCVCACDAHDMNKMRKLCYRPVNNRTILCNKIANNKRFLCSQFCIN